MGELRFYLDENVPVSVANQLVTRGIDVITVRGLGTLGHNDEWHLMTATDSGRVLCTHDMDFIRLAMDGMEHAGIVVAPGRRFGIGDWVRSLYQLHVRWQAEDFINRVEYL